PDGGERRGAELERVREPALIPRRWVRGDRRVGRDWGALSPPREPVGRDRGEVVERCGGQPEGLRLRRPTGRVCQAREPREKLPAVGDPTTDRLREPTRGGQRRSTRAAQIARLRERAPHSERLRELAVPGRLECPAKAQPPLESEPRAGLGCRLLLHEPLERL